MGRKRQERATPKSRPSSWWAGIVLVWFCYEINEMRKLIIWVAILLIVFTGCAVSIRYYIAHQSRQPVLEKLNDPDSAKFRNERFVGGWTISGVMCGEINAKNRMGGYIGYVKYYTVLSGGVPIDSHIVEPDDAFRERMFEDTCIVNRHWDNAWGWLYW